MVPGIVVAWQEKGIRYVVMWWDGKIMRKEGIWWYRVARKGDGICCDVVEWDGME